MTSNLQHRESAGAFSYLPVELLNQIISSLSNRSIKNLRQTCTFLSKIAQLRLDRVFLSTNPLDIEAFTAIAQDDTLRLGVREIIYDDARFWDEYGLQTTAFIPTLEDYDFETATGVSPWYRYFYSDEVKKAREILEKDRENLAHIKVSDDCEESYKRYQKLLQGQKEVIAQSRDISALRYGLARFPNLTRVELTIATYGRQLEPFYYTPTIRSLPQDLIYPSARGWPGTLLYEDVIPYVEAWEGEEKEKWRGFCVVTREVARHLRENPTSRIAEFSIDVNDLPSGINFRLFENTESAEYTDLVTIMSHPGLKRFDLPLYTVGVEDPDDSAALYNQLYDLLSIATDLQHVSLSTNIDFQDELWEIVGRAEHCFPLCTIFPIDNWSNLRHFSLSRLFVKQADVRNFLAAMPTTLKSIELSFLEFTPWYRDCYRGLFEDMRSTLGWQHRPRDNQPKIRVLVERKGGKVVDVSAEAESYMYDEGENPFTIGSNPFYPEKRFYVFYDVGIEVDVFDPNYKRL
ncbi:uncharacterized protein B0J16DRAFT_349456 [Fusarium flagelliforme]|uniref:uncharacterized protein n=1 Tax=Fusarium flagelliforme TaxID=2675880 RepID=UPI001E8D1AC3|nr:uncharacterized protein B0J16DRAFT_349456 [Fusarium flagelliforme]KAH7175037.1 hypothetical protein B0J16DRAFT_349456 [Fusarium flagelliforme]